MKQLADGEAGHKVHGKLSPRSDRARPRRPGAKQQSVRYLGVGSTWIKCISVVEMIHNNVFLAAAQIPEFDRPLH